MRSLSRRRVGALPRYRVRRVGLAVGFVVVAASIGGCSLGPQTRQAKAMQAAITGAVVVDTLQTVSFVKAEGGCVREANPLAFGGNAYPQEKDVWRHNILYGLGHWLLGGFLDRKAVGSEKWAKAQKWYWRLTLGGHGLAVASNARQGFHPFTEVKCE